MSGNKQKAQFHIRCVEADAESIIDMVDRSRQVSYETFARNCDIAELAESLGYARGREPGLKLHEDRCVSFHKSVFRGMPCYYMDWSAIEHVFVTRQALLEKQAGERPLRQSRHAEFSGAEPSF